MDSELQAIIEKAVAAGHSDEDVRLIAEEHKRRQEPSKAIAQGERWAALPVKDKIKEAFAWGGNIFKKDLVDAGTAAVTEVKEHPIRTAATLALPGVVGAGFKYAKPLVGPVARKAAGYLEDPIIGGAVGAIEGSRRGPQGAITGALYGAAGSSIFGRIARHVGGKGPTVSKNTGGTLVKAPTRITPERVASEALEEARMTPGVVAGSGGTSIPARANRVSTSDTTETIARQRAQGLPVNPELAIAPPNPANQGGTLRGSSPSMNDTLVAGMDEARAIPTPGLVSGKPSVPPLRGGATGRGELTDDTLARAERLFDRNPDLVPVEQAQAILLRREMARMADEATRSEPVTSRLVDKAVKGGGKAVAAEAKTNAATINTRIAKVVDEEKALRPPQRSIAGIPASKSKRTEMSATPGLTVNDTAAIGLNPALPIKKLSTEAITTILKARLERSGMYRSEAQLNAELRRLLDDSSK